VIAGTLKSMISQPIKRRRARGLHAEAWKPPLDSSATLPADDVVRLASDLFANDPSISAGEALREAARGLKPQPGQDKTRAMAQFDAAAAHDARGVLEHEWRGAYASNVKQVNDFLDASLGKTEANALRKRRAADGRLLESNPATMIILKAMAEAPHQDQSLWSQHYRRNLSVRAGYIDDSFGPVDGPLMHNARVRDSIDRMRGSAMRAELEPVIAEIRAASGFKRPSPAEAAEVARLFPRTHRRLREANDGPLRED
jgi:hypothetical protein